MIELFKDESNSSKLETIQQAISRFFKAKFGEDAVLKYEVYKSYDPNGVRYGADLMDIIQEFVEIYTCERIKELQNPRTKEFILIDEVNATILGTYESSFLNQQLHNDNVK